MKRFWKYLFIACTFLLLNPVPANAGPVAAAATAWIISTFAITSVTAAEIIYLTVEAVIYASVSIGLTYLGKAISGNRDNSALSGAGQTMQTGGIIPRSFIIGEFETPGKLTYVNTWGDNGATPNAYITIVIALSDLPLETLYNVFAAEKLLTYAQGTLGTKGYAIPEYQVSGVDYMWIKFYNGNQTTGDTFLHTTFGSDPDYPYDSTRVGKGVSYAIVTMLDNPQLFPSIPVFKFHVQGIPLYDQRYDSTAGGTGSQRFDTKSTWVSTNNPVVAINNILRGITYNGNWVYGLQNLDVSRVPSDSWFAAANECDSTITNKDGNQEAQFRFGIEISVEVSPADAIDELLKACNGRLAEVGGVYKIHVGAANSSILSFSDNDILVTEQQSYSPFPSQSAIVNGITATYPEPSQAWAKTDAPGRYNTDFEELDGGRFVVNVDYVAVPFLEQVQRLMASAILEARKFRKHTLVLPPECWVLEPNDIVSFTSTRNGYSSKQFRVDVVNDNANLDILVVLSECDPADYDWVSSSDFVPRVDGPLIIARPPTSQPILDWSVTNSIVVGTDSRQKAAITLSWATDVTDVQAVQYQVRLYGETDLVHSGVVTDWEGGTATISENILSATHYEVRGKYIPYSSRDTTYSDWLGVTTDDVRVQNIDLDILAVEFENFAVTLQNLQITVAQQQRDLLDSVSLLSVSASQAHLGSYTDKQELLASLSSTTADITADYTSAIVAATGPSSAIVSDITTLTAGLTTANGNISANASAITILNTTVTSQGTTIVSNSASITSLTSSLSTTNGTVSANSSAITALQTQVTTDGTNITSNASSITSLQSALTGYTTSNAVATAFTSLNTSVTSINGTLTSHSSSITSLNSGLSTANGNISTNASAISALQTQVTTDGTNISSNSSSITSLNNALTGYTTSGAVASAFTSLNSSVTSINGTLTSQASSITGLTSQVGNFYASGLFRASTTATASGADASIALEVAASSGGGSYTAALFLDAMSGGATRIRMYANQIIMTDGSNNYAPFSFSGGVLTVDNAVIKNLQTGNIQSGAVSARVWSGYANGISVTTSQVTLNNATITTAGNDVDIDVSCDFDSSSAPSVTFQVRRGSTSGTVVLTQTIGGGTMASRTGFAAMSRDTGSSAGSNTYYLVASRIGGSNFTADRCQLRLQEIKV